MITFKANTEISARSICDHNCIFTAKIIKRTAKTVTIQQVDKKAIGIYHIKEYNDTEYIMPLGRFSMSPSSRAENIVKGDNND